ncbi:hypothetical protein P152DRAFT_98738 [Eremomyces bilateralis CBS 781.70]|uniref:Nascent polypeptide-associated complex subunit alpha-like UBA domain-containing protein n=1 Tax=Eremomyces bilateralis CBS 781.70 TaxID=1392243 RepID=A0A6G1FXG3_9PEZI|nr:uncharacterized protein P152DRAFT_98738 [Eremomyces bilateralis CBS 781.70]KAF1810438.1 hypothetical protein P152DRAFT_98738 [Eremomyces bilateralis CBS 781.70]
MASHETEQDEEPQATGPGSAEDRKAAAALEALDAHDADERATRNVDAAEALGQAMRALEVKDKKEDAEAKKVKVETADITLVMNELEMPKAKATELLKKHEGDAIRAMKSYVLDVAWA